MPAHDLLQELARADTEYEADHAYEPGVTLAVLFDRLQIQTPDWMEQAACRGYPTSWWFPGAGEDVERGKAICETCPVKTECLDYAVEHRIRVGIWGGTTATRRIRAWQDAQKAQQRQEPTPTDP